jgi:hypothetical protein
VTIPGTETLTAAYEVLLPAGAYHLRVRLVEAHTRIALTAWAARDFTVVHCRFTLSGAALHRATVGQVKPTEPPPAACWSRGGRCAWLVTCAFRSSHSVCWLSQVACWSSHVGCRMSHVGHSMSHAFGLLRTFVRDRCGPAQHRAAGPIQDCSSPATSAPGLGSSLPHLHQDWAQRMAPPGRLAGRAAVRIGARVTLHVVRHVACCMSCGTWHVVCCIQPAAFTITRHGCSLTGVVDYVVRVHGPTIFLADVVQVLVRSRTAVGERSIRFARAHQTNMQIVLGRHKRDACSLRTATRGMRRRV